MSSHRRQQWSPWEWSQERGVYFRYTTDQYGQPQAWDYAVTVPRSPAEPQPPDLSALSIHGSPGDAYTTAPLGDPYLHGGSYGGTSKKSKKSSKSRKHLDRDQEPDPPDPFYPPPATTQDSSNAYLSSAPITTETHQDSGHSQHVPYDPYQAAVDYGGGHHRKSRKGKDKAQWSSPAIPDPPYAQQEEEVSDADLDAAINRSRNEYMSGPASTGASSSSEVVSEPYYEPYARSDPPTNYIVGEASGERTPRAASPVGSGSAGARGASLMDAIQGDPSATGYSEKLDERYKVEPSHKFVPGEVFKLLWSEPIGQGGYGPQGRADMTDLSVRENLGERFYVGFRRFIVVANDQGHCTCVPILTYEHRGCCKKGVKANKHGIVYQIGSKARMLEGEPRLGFAPVRLELDWSTEKIARESRVNYSKLVTIEHNVKVLFIGRVYSEDFDILTEAVNKCWDEKNHRPSKHHRHPQ